CRRLCDGHLRLGQRSSHPVGRFAARTGSWRMRSRPSGRANGTDADVSGAAFVARLGPPPARHPGRFARYSLPDEVEIMSLVVFWHGTPQEALELVHAVGANCGCECGMMGVRTSVCEAHKMLTGDQRALDGLIFVRRLAERLLQEEFSAARPPKRGR